MIATSTGFEAASTFAVNTINPSSVVVTFADQPAAPTSATIICQAGIKLDPITGDFTVEFIKTTTVSLNVGNGNFGGYPAVGALSTLNGKWGIAGIDVSTVKPNLTYMNVIT